MNRTKFESDKWEDMDWCRCGDEGVYKVCNIWMCETCYWLVFVERVCILGWEDLFENERDTLKER